MFSTFEQVRSAGKGCWQVPIDIVGKLVRTLESSLPLRFDELAADLIEDGTGKWWLTQVRGISGD